METCDNCNREHKKGNCPHCGHRNKEIDSIAFWEKVEKQTKGIHC